MRFTRNVWTSLKDKQWAILFALLTFSTDEVASVWVELVLADAGGGDLNEGKMTVDDLPRVEAVWTVKTFQTGA